MKNRKLSDSFRNAFRGLGQAFVRERNMRIHTATAVLCILLGVVCCLDPISWAVVFVAIGLVVVAELLNTAIERVMDMINPEYSRKAGAVKDIAAGAVLVAAIVAAILGILVFAPPLLRLAGIS